MNYDLIEALYILYECASLAPKRKFKAAIESLPLSIKIELFNIIRAIEQIEKDTQ